MCTKKVSRSTNSKDLGPPFRKAAILMGRQKPVLDDDETILINHQTNFNIDPNFNFNPTPTVSLTLFLNFAAFQNGGSLE